MPAVFLTTPALQIFLLWPQSSIARFLATCLTNEVWISPLSHAIVEDTFLQTGPSPLARRGRREVERHRRHMETAGSATYPLPTSDAVRIWFEIRSLKIDIPPYSDGEVKYPAQKVGPDELLVFATAGAFSKPLIGPAPTNSETLDYLKDLGITFRSFGEAAGVASEDAEGKSNDDTGSVPNLELLEGKPEEREGWLSDLLRRATNEQDTNQPR